MLTRIGRAALVPWWTAQLLTGTKSFERNAVIGSHLLNQFGLHETRVRLAHEVAQSRRRRLEHLVAAVDRADFARDGFVVKRGFLPPQAFAELRHQVGTYRGPLREIAEGDTIMRKVALYPRLVEAAAVAHEPHRVAFYLYDLASEFHAQWTRGTNSPHLRFIILDDPLLTVARLALVQGVVTVLASGLRMLGVGAPGEMR